MKGTALFSLAGLVPYALAAPAMPECDNSLLNTPCKCPAGTEFVSCTTYATMGANAKDVADLARSCKYILCTLTSEGSIRHGMRIAYDSQTQSSMLAGSLQTS